MSCHGQAPAVTAVQAPIQTTAPANVLNRFQPMCMPPSKSTKINATVTIRSLMCRKAELRKKVRNGGSGDQEHRRRGAP